jgi:hypothetical protein
LRFGDFLRTTVLLSAGSATALGVITVISLADVDDYVVAYVSFGWWAIAAILGARIGRGTSASPQIARLLADARHQTMLPELRPGSTLINRLWPLLIATFVAGVLGIFIPQVSSVAAGFAIIWALAWRRQHLAVMAIEERDAARFYVDKTPALQPIRLVRTPGFGGKFFRAEA